MDDDYFEEPSGPLSGAALVEFQAIMRHAAVEDLKAKAEELTAICRGLPRDRMRRLAELIG